MMLIHEIRLFELRIELNFQCKTLAVVNYYVVAGKAWKIIIDPHNDHLSVGLIAQVVVHCTVIREAKVQFPFRPEFFRS